MRKTVRIRPNLLIIMLVIVISFAHASIVAISQYLDRPLNEISDITSTHEPASPPEETEIDSPVTIPDYTFSTNLIIRAINPGYKDADNNPDVGELIELYKTIDGDLDLSGYSLRYTNGSGTSTEIWKFSEGTVMHGKSLVLRYAKAIDSTSSDATYATSLALSAGPLDLLLDGDVVDKVCWTGKTDCAKAFKSATPTTLVRDLTTGEFAHLEKYSSDYDATGSAITWPIIPDDPVSDETSDSISSRCQGLEFTEVYSYYEVDATEQFIELYNSTSQNIDVTHCGLKYKNKTYPITGIVTAESYAIFRPEELGFSLTKNPSTSNTVSLIDSNAQTIDELVYIHGQKKSTSYALIYDQNGEANWMVTYARTPGYENTYQKFRTCESGKVINEATGNCIKATSLEATTTDCPEGKYRNPLTNRCKTIETSTSPKPCAEGYERNPETNRCRKITAENDGAGYALVPMTSTNQKSFIALGIVGLLVTAGVVYIILQFRLEILRFLRKLRQRFHRVR